MGVEYIVREEDGRKLRVPKVSHYNPHIPQYLKIPEITRPLTDKEVEYLSRPFSLLTRLCAKFL